MTISILSMARVDFTCILIVTRLPELIISFAVALSLSRCATMDEGKYSTVFIWASFPEMK